MTKSQILITEQTGFLYRVDLRELSESIWKDT